MVRRFLGCIVVLTLIAVVGAFAIYQFGDRMMARMATPEGHFEAPAVNSGPDYGDPGNWLARPAMADNPAQWLPEGYAAPPATGDAAVFYIHPTTYLDTDRWNAPLVTTGQTADRTALFVRHQASAFSGAGEIWAPRYRQAAFGAFLLKSEDASKALDLAYGDVNAAFETFLTANPDRPLILAGHSQGALHLLRLLGEHGPMLKDRLVAAYVVGWPVGIAADLPKTGLNACATAASTHCVLSWQSFGSPANPNLILDSWVGTDGLSGAKQRRADMLCTDPISGVRGGKSVPSANPGTLNPDTRFTNARLVAGQVGAACENGFLLVDGDIPSLGAFALPGNNLHPYDYALFWAAVRADAERRLKAFETER